jgi:hypothetical protein
MLKVIVDFCNYVDWSGRREILKNAIAFPSCGVDSRMLIQRPAGVVRGREDPQVLKPVTPADARFLSANQQASLTQLLK